MSFDQHLTGADFEAVVTEPGGGTAIRVSLAGIPDIVTFKVTGEQSAGTITFLEYEAQPGSHGVRPHTHDGHEELFYVTEGVLRMRLRDEIIDAAAGSCVFVPRDVVHSFWNPTDEIVRFVGSWTPSGFEHLFTEREELAAEHGDLTPEQNEGLAARHGVHYVPMLPGEGE